VSPADSLLSSDARPVVRLPQLQITTITAERKPLKDSKSRIKLWNGDELQFHAPRPTHERIHLQSFIPAEYQNSPLEIEIGPGKGEFIANRAQQFPQHYFIGIDRRLDRVRLSQKKLTRLAVADSETGKNWVILKEDARCFLEAGIPLIDGLHLYQPDPWPKDRQHKHRFFRSPDARQWASQIKSGGFFSFSTDHPGYFAEMIDIVKTWGFLELNWAWQKTRLSGAAKTHFEGIFLRQNKPVYKALYRRV